LPYRLTPRAGGPETHADKMLHHSLIPPAIWTSTTSWPRQSARPVDPPSCQGAAGTRTDYSVTAQTAILTRPSATTDHQLGRRPLIHLMKTAYFVDARCTVLLGFSSPTDAGLLRELRLGYPSRDGTFRRLGPRPSTIGFVAKGWIAAF